MKVSGTLAGMVWVSLFGKAGVRRLLAALCGLVLAACAPAVATLLPAASDAPAPRVSPQAQITPQASAPPPNSIGSPSVAGSPSGAGSPSAAGSPSPTGRRAAPPSPPPPTATIPPTSAPAASPALSICRDGRIETGQILTPFADKPLHFRVYLPPCYDEQPQRTYPALYLIHGLSYNDDQWDRLGVDETANELIRAGELPPFLIVMPRDDGWEQPASDPFDEMVVEALIPWVEGNYRACTARACRAVGGLSRGAGWAARLGLAHWGLFGAVGAHSLAAMWEDAPLYAGWLEAIPAEERPRVYLDVGDHEKAEILASALDFERLLTAANAPHEFHRFAGYHNEIYWQAHVADYLRWYAAGWAE